MSRGEEGVLVLPVVGYTGRIIWKGHKTKVKEKEKEMAAKAKCIKVCQILNEIMQNTKSLEPLGNWARRTKNTGKMWRS